MATFSGRAPRVGTALVLLLSGPLASAATAPATDPGAAVREIGAAYLAGLTEESLFLRLKNGLPIQHLPDLSLARAEARGQQAAALRARLAAVPEAGLAEEMGMYEDPYDLCGRLAMDMFISVRLVVDTGMNALGWPRAKAVAYMREHVMESDTQIGTESLRYSVDIPGQALAYKMGSRGLLDLRRRAEQALGPRFDVRRFHECLLGSGSLPLDTLSRKVDLYIAKEKHP